VRRFPGSHSRPIRRAAAAVCLALAAGCATTAKSLPADGPLPRQVIGRSFEGRAITGHMLGTGPETYLLFGVIHGNETLGGPLLERFERYASRHPEMLEGKRLVVVPVLNPDGLARNSRANARGVDLNRNFPSRNWRPSPRHGNRPASEVETRILLQLIREYRPSRILSIHSPLHCVNFDGPAEEIASQMARAAGYPVRASIGYPTPGSLGSYAGRDLEIPTITLELSPGLSEAEHWSALQPALECFVTHPSPARSISRRPSATTDRRAV
jgi:murein peptide amidase A